MLEDKKNISNDEVEDVTVADDGEFLDWMLNIEKEALANLEAQGVKVSEE